MQLFLQPPKLIDFYFFFSINLKILQIIIHVYCVLRISSIFTYEYSNVHYIYYYSLTYVNYVSIDF